MSITWRLHDVMSAELFEEMKVAAGCLGRWPERRVVRASCLLPNSGDGYTGQADLIFYFATR